MRSKITSWTSKRASRAAFCVLLLLAVIAPAQAQFATGGTGVHRGRIFWVDWGTNGENVFAGRTITRGFNVGTPASPANRLDITCTLSNATSTGAASLAIYTPGNWQGDGLDDLYNIGGNHPGQGANPNTLSVGLRTPSSTTVEFDFACNATLGGAPFNLSGLVFADAEASGGTEFVAARLTNGGTLRVIDEIAQCRGGDANIRSTVTVGGTPEEVRFAGPSAAASCENNPTPSLRAGPALVGFIDGALSARVIARGAGISAVAVGAVIDLEFSEAIPASYGTAAVHVLNTNWGGGIAVTGGDYNNRANLAAVVPGVRLGDTVESDPDADGAVGGSDVDGLPKTNGPLGSGYAAVPPPSGPPGTNYTISNVACVGPAWVRGWIDFDGNGSFDADEDSEATQCPSGSGSVSLTWTTIPADYAIQATSYMRLRLAPDEDDVANPIGLATDGEVEDYRLALPQIVPTMTIAKISTGGVGTFSFTGDNGFAGQSLTTTAPNTTVSGAAQSLSAAGTPVTLTEGATTGFALTGIVCTGLGAGGTATPDLAARTVILDSAATAADANITCTFTNSAIANLQITKTNTPANGPTDASNDTVAPSASVDYSIVVSNLGPGAADGAVVRDTPLTGLICSTATCGSETNGAACPAATGPTLATAMQSASGIGIPTLPAGGSVTLTLSCNVTP